jgi:hypothetical protein
MINNHSKIFIFVCVTELIPGFQFLIDILVQEKLKHKVKSRYIFLFYVISVAIFEFLMPKYIKSQSIFLLCFIIPALILTREEMYDRHFNPWRYSSRPKFQKKTNNQLRRFLKVLAPYN